MLNRCRECFKSENVIHFGLFVNIVVQVGLTYMAFQQATVMKKEWPKVITERGETVLVAQMPAFWGPVHILVPTTCKEVRHYAEIVEEAEKKLAESGQETEDLMSGELDTDGEVMDIGEVLGRSPRLEKEKGPVKEKGKEKEKGAEKEKERRLETQKGSSSKHAKAKSESTEEKASKSDSQKDAVTRSSKKKDEPKKEKKKSYAIRPECKEKGKHGKPPSAEDRMIIRTPGLLSKYLAMITLSNMVTGNTPTIAELHASRLRMYRWIWLGLIFTMTMKYSMKILDIIAICHGKKYVQLWNNGRTTIDKVIESIMIHGTAISFTLVQQVTLCTLFLAFWQEDHFVMTYVPGVGFVCFFVSMAFFASYITLDRVMGWMLWCDSWYIKAFWVLWLAWFLCIVVPMMGYMAYIAQFVFKIVMSHWIHREPFSAEFVFAARKSMTYCGWFVVVSLVDLGVIIKIDIDAGRVHKSKQESNFLC